MLRIHRKSLYATVILCFSCLFVMAQEKNITGKVTDSTSGQPLKGVVVSVSGISSGKITGVDGSYSTKARQADTLTFSHVGYSTVFVPVKNQTTINVVLHRLEKELEDVVVIGYGTVNRKDVTGAIGEVKMNDLMKAPVASFDESLAGRIAGVQVSSNEGQPGEEMNIVIRGGNSLTQSNSPLFVIDGFPIEDPGAAALNPADIKSINILKDASATAIYGSRGANGVVIIETKQGQAGKARIEYEGSAGFQQVTKKMEMMDSYEFVKYLIELNPDVNKRVYLTRPGRELEDYKNIKAIDWQDLMFRNAFMQSHNLSLSGGNAQTKYRISGSLFNRNGVVINSGYDRKQFRIVLDQSITDKIKAGINLNYTNDGNYGSLSSTSQGVSTGYSTYQLYRIWGYRPVTGNESADLVDDVMDEEEEVSFADARINPLISAQNEIRKETRNIIIGNAYLKMDVAKNLQLNVRGGINKRWIKDEEFYNSKTARGYPSVNNSRGVNGLFNSVESNEWVNENTLTFDKRNINKRHSINALIGATIQGEKYYRYGYEAQHIINESLGLSGMDDATPGPLVALHSDNTLLSFLARANYSFRSKYMVSTTWRADGSSKFSPENRWAYFPSFGLAWRLSRESFMRTVNFISDAKLRMSFGVTGNNRIGDFVRFSSLTRDYERYYPVGGNPSPGIVPNRFGNEGLKWETTRQTDLGLDLKLFRDRIDLSFDVYRKVTSDLLLNANVPYSTGFTTIYKNVGVVRNEGLEISLNTTNIRNKNFTWTTNFNISFNRNKVMELAENETQLLSDISWTSTYNNQPLYMARLGGSAASFVGYMWDGVYQYADFDELPNGEYVLKNSVTTNGLDRGAIQPGDIKYIDVNEDGIVNEKDIVVIGRGLPVHIGGFNNNFEYKGFSLNVFFQWSYGNDIFNTNRLMFEGNSEGRGHLNQYASYINRWSPENQTNENYRPGGQGLRGIYSSKYIEDGSYLRLKTVSLAYSFPKRWIQAAKLSRLEAYVSAQNLVTWTKYTGMDPEVSVRHSMLTPGFDYSAYPNAKTIAFGIRAAF